MIKYSLNNSVNPTNTKGFTLVELIVALVIAAIVIAAAGAFMISSTNLVAHQVTRAQQEAITDATVGFIKDRMLYAQSITLVKGQPIPPDDGSGAVLYVGDSDAKPSNQGFLYFRRAGDAQAVNVFGESFYQTCKISLDYSTTVSADPDKAKTFSVTVKIYANGNQQYSATNTYKLINSGLTDEPLASATAQGESEKYYLLIKGS